MDDRYDISEVCIRMLWHADRREWDAVRAVFADRVLLDYTSLAGGEPATLTPDEIVTAWADTLGGFDATQHLVTNYLVTVDGAHAVCTAAFQATHVLATAFGDPLWTLGGDYRFELTRADDGWRIASLVMTARWGSGNQQLSATAAGN